MSRRRRPKGDGVFLLAYAIAHQRRAHDTLPERILYSSRSARCGFHLAERDEYAQLGNVREKR